MKIIALYGYAGVGKDTVADILVRDHGYVKVAFADRIKQLLYEQDPTVYHDESLKELVDTIGWDAAKREYSEVRRLLQVTGETVKKILGNDVWIWPVLEEARKYERVVISDLRFMDEYSALKSTAPVWSASLRVLRIWRDDVKPANDHISENTIIPYDKMVDLSRVGLEEMPSLVGVLADYADLDAA